MTIIRDPIDEPHLISTRAIAKRPSFIDFIHPGYAESVQDAEGDVLLSLKAFDDNGIDYDTAHTACSILCANRWDGYFSLDRDGSTTVQQPRDGILRQPRYYFHIPSQATSGRDADPYPVVARFSDWRFPHGNLPPLWERLKNELEANQVTTRSCCLSNYADAVESAHLVPSAQVSWWSSNRIARYVDSSLSSTDPINAAANLIPLRSDIHEMFNERHFTFVPKISHNGDGPPQTERVYLVGHVFNSTPSGQLPVLWHNRRVHTLPPEVSVECLFSRFAWTIFSPTVFRDFLDAGIPRHIVAWNSETRRHDVEVADADRCRAIWSASRSRSESPRKNKRRAASPSQDGREHHVMSDEDSGYYGCTGCFGSGSEPALASPEEPDRGRSRKRKANVSPEKRRMLCLDKI
ncbi:hypothetical protein F66182_3318 [Fusarium sp. NRRL 66182]|nr:hypothetical protein F66182_3318 [Fusarium sp. NRRL 66182]